MTNYQKVWEGYYLETTGVPFYFDTKEASCLKKLRERIIWYCDQKGYTNQTDEFYNERLKGFLYKITDVFVLQRLVPSMVLQQFNILLAQAEGKKVKDKPEVYVPVKFTRDEPGFEEAIKRQRKAERELAEIRSPTRGESLRLAVTGTSTPAQTGHLLVDTIAKKYTKDKKK